MKKFVITGTLCFLVCLSFGQKKAISAADGNIKGNNPNIAEARLLIKGALSNPETANNAEAWFVAGKIENKQLDKEKEKEILSKTPNYEVMYGALGNFLPYFIKAAELDQLPDAKGKVKPRFLKDIRAITRVNRPYFINAGIYYYDNKDYEKAYNFFKTYSDIPKLSMYDDEKWNIAEGDTVELQVRYYTGLAASQISDHKAALEIFNDIKYKGLNETEIYKQLAFQYDQLGDSASYEQAIMEGILKFPDEDYFIKNIINICIYSNKANEAIPYLEKAISQNSNNAQLYDVLGQIFEADKKNDEAIINMKKALSIEPENIEYLLHIGRVYFNLGVEKRGESDVVSDKDKSKELLNQSLDSFKESMPYFEKIYELDPKNLPAISALLSIYYSLRMPQYEKIEEIYNNLSNADKE